MWDVGPNVNCQLVKRSEDEANFIRVARGRGPGVRRKLAGILVLLISLIILWFLGGSKSFRSWGSARSLDAVSLVFTHYFA